VRKKLLGLCSTTAGEKVILSTGVGVEVDSGVGDGVGDKVGVIDGNGVDDCSAGGSRLGEIVEEIAIVPSSASGGEPQAENENDQDNPN